MDVLEAFNKLIQLHRKETRKYYLGFAYREKNMFEDEVKDLEKIYEEQIKELEKKETAYLRPLVSYMESFVKAYRDRGALEDKLATLRDKRGDDDDVSDSD